MSFYTALGQNIQNALNKMVEIGANKDADPGVMMGQLMEQSAIVNNQNFAAGTARQHNQKIGQSQ